MSSVQTVRTVVMFQSGDFNCTEPREYFINDCCFGDDVAKWMRDKLNAAGYAAAEPGQEDFGWYLPFKANDVDYFWIIGFRPGESGEGQWIAWLEQRRKGLTGLFRPKPTINPQIVQVIHTALAGDSRIQNIKWLTQSDFDKGNEEAFATTPT
jgi:hypothetical protein